MRYLTIMAVALGALMIPTSALAKHGGHNKDCQYANAKGGVGVSQLGKTVIVYATTTPHAKAGACADFNNNKTAGPIRFDGGTVEVGAGEDPGTGSGDPGGTQPDAYAVVDGDDDNVDPQGQSDGYVGVSNWETSNGRTTEEECSASGPNNGNAGSSNSGGCVGPAPAGPWVYVPNDVPTPICGNTSGNAWDGSGTAGSHNRDGCQFP